MFDVGGGELMLIVLAILVFFGPKKIPEVAQMVGRGMRKIRQAQDELTTQFRELSVEQPIQSVTTSTPSEHPVAHQDQTNDGVDHNFISQELSDMQNSQLNSESVPLGDTPPPPEQERIIPQSHPQSVSRSPRQTKSDNDH